MAAMAAMAAMDSDAKLSMHDLDQRSSASGEAHPSPALVFGRSPLRSASVSRPPARSLGSNASPVLPPPRPHARSLSQLSRTFTLSSTELEAPPPTRWQRAQQTCSAISDARPTMVAMGLVTVFALFGDDVRLAWLPPSADLGFLVATFAAMTLSFAEVAVNVVGKRESYLWSFVFFMDLLTASSLLVDCSMLWVGQSAVEGADTLRRIGRLGAQAGRLVRIVRLVRLVRLNRVLAAIERVRAMRKESQRKSASGSQGAGNGSSGRRATQPSMVGRRYADASSRAVVLLVLLLYVIFSIVHDADTHAVSHKKSLVLLHRMPQDRNVSREVFKWSVQSFALSSQQLLYFRVCSTGCAQTYTSAELQGWAEEAGGSGYVTPSELSTQYRREELVSLYLDQCYEGGQRVVRGTLCESTAVYSVQAASRDDAVRSILRTLLLGSVMFLSALAFVLDAQQLVIGPIERMTGLVRALGDNPLVCVQLGLENQKFMQQPKQRKGCTHAAIAMARRKGKQPSYETALLEDTLNKIGALLHIGFGEAGTDIIAANVAREGRLDPMVLGRKTWAAFAFCDIRQFTDTTECLQEEVMVFVNRVGAITHDAVHHYSGAANKNIGDAFLFTWKLADFGPRVDLLIKSGQWNRLSELPSYAPDGSGLQDCFWIDELAADPDAVHLADSALAAIIKCHVDISISNMSGELRQYQDVPSIRERFGGNFQVRMGYGLHAGWAVVGAIGTVYKIDASYLSPHVNMAARMEECTKTYSVPILFTSWFYCLLSDAAKRYCRPVDSVWTNSTGPMELFTFDVLNPTHPVGTEYTIEFDEDEDLPKLQVGLHADFVPVYYRGYEAFTQGQWEEARSLLQHALTLKEGDGPSTVLLEFMSRTDFVAPEDWGGYRPLE